MHLVTIKYTSYLAILEGDFMLFLKLCLYSVKSYIFAILGLYDFSFQKRIFVRSSFMGSNSIVMQQGRIAALMKLVVNVVLVNQQCEQGSRNSKLAISTLNIMKAADVTFNLATAN